MYIARMAQSVVSAALKRQDAVAILGTRQVGKTTLAKNLAYSMDSHYIDLETVDSNLIANPNELFDYYQDRLLILDEIHLFPRLFSYLRSAIDKGRWVGNRNGRFLLLGSASLDVVNKSSQSLAGRIEFVELNPLNVLEAATTRPTSRMRDSHVADEQARPVDQSKVIKDLWFRGGLPDSFLSANDQDSNVFRMNFIRTYLERDIPFLGFRVPAPTLRSFWTLLAHGQGQLQNASDLASSLSISASSVIRYIDLLENLLVVRCLRPYLGNVKKRLVKSPKIYLRDSGILHALLGISEFDELLVNQVLGASWEGFVIENLLSVAPWGTRAGFYRTSAGAEIDLILEIPAKNEIWAVEIKHKDPTRLSRGFYSAIEDIKPNRVFIVHSGEMRFPVKSEFTAIGLEELVRMLHEQR